METQCTRGSEPQISQCSEIPQKSILDNDICCDPTYYGFTIVHMVTWGSPILRNKTKPISLNHQQKSPAKIPPNDHQMTGFAPPTIEPTEAL